MLTLSQVGEMVDNLVDYKLRLRDVQSADKTNQSKPYHQMGRYERLFSRDFETLPRPAHDKETGYGQALSLHAKWMEGRGDRVAYVWMFKPDSKLRLLIQQYGTESPICSILQLDRSQPKSKALPFTGDIEKMGKSPWVKFHATDGAIENVRDILVDRGWYQVKVESTPGIQYELKGMSKGVT